MVRVVMDFFGIVPLIVTDSDGLHVFYRSGHLDTEHLRSCGCCGRALCHSGWQTWWRIEER